MNQKKFAVIGGDTRNLSLSEILTKEGHIVNTFALSDRDSATLELALKDVDMVIGPLPFTTDMKTLNTPLFREQIYISNFFKAISNKSIFIAGKLDEPILKQSRQHNFRTIDILNREDFSVLNAIPSAEGAIQIAMQETPYTLNSSNILITGYGRIGKVLSHMLKGLGANVYLASRRFDDRAYGVAFGIKHYEYGELKSNIGDMDIIFNTVPALVLDSEILKCVNTNSLIIDLASKPGGVDFEKAKELGIKTIWALSLPGKVAPQTSAKIVRDIIFNIIREMEV